MAGRRRGVREWRCGNMLYFAYGSNLNASELHLRCREARDVGKVTLEDYRFCFPFWSRIRQSGLMRIEPVLGERVWRVLYELRESDFTRLDQREGFDRERPPS